MNWLVLAFCLELGIIPNGAFLMYDRLPIEYINESPYALTSVDVLNFGNSIYTDLQFEATVLDYLFIGGGVKILMLSTNDYTFDPHALNYNFVFGCRIGPMEIFWRHYCMHPQMTYMYDYIPLDGWEGMYDELGIKIEGQVSWLKKENRR